MDGHAPGVSGKALNAYVAAGIASDHECTTSHEALEKLELGMRIMVREGTCARNLDALFPVIETDTWHRMMWSTDDRHPHDLLNEGHVDAVIRKAVDKGLDPITAIRMGTITAADYFGINDAGAIAPGRKANLVVFSDLSDIRAERVFFMGKPVAESGQLLPDIERPKPVAVPPSMDLNPNELNFTIPVKGNRARVIRVIPDQVVTRCEIMDVVAKGDVLEADVANDIVKMAVVERYTGQGQTGLGLVTGLGLKQGAIASSVAHDSHNIIVAGTSDVEMMTATEIVVKMGGGLAAVKGGRALATLPLPVAGLMSDRPMETVQRLMERMLDAARSLGSTLSDPFMTLGFLALPVIPHLKLTDRGLVDVNRFEIVPLFV
jgi:adenine deaminase